MIEDRIVAINRNGLDLILGLIREQQALRMSGPQHAKLCDHGVPELHSYGMGFLESWCR